MSAVSVLYLSLYGTRGGAEAALLELLAALDRERFRPLVVLARDGPLGEALRARDVEVVVEPFPTPPLQQLLLPWVLLAEARAALRLLRLVRARAVRVVHCGDVLGLLLLLPSALAGARVVYQLHYLGGRPRVLALNALALASVDAIVAYSADQRRALLAQTWGLAGRTRVVYPGIDPDEWGAGDGAALRRELGIALGEPLVGLLARFDTWKGHATFLEAAALVVAARPEARFLIAGGALNADRLPHVARCRDQALALRRRLGLEPTVAILEHRADVPGLLAALDLLVVPSVHEPFGMVVLEALAAGTPVLASDTGGPAEILEDGRSGLLFATGSAVALAERVRLLLDDPELRDRLSRAGKLRVRTGFRRERYARQIEVLYAGAA